MPVIYLVRHGQASYGTADYDRLSVRGRRQASALGSVLAGRCGRIDRAQSGTMRRQVDTAGECLAAVGPTAPTACTAAEQDSRWNEYDFADIITRHGPPETEPVADAQQAADAQPGAQPAGQGALDVALHGWIDAGEASACAESFPAFTRRVTSAVDDLAGALGKGEAGVVFTSGGPIAAIAARLMALPPSGFVALNRVVANGGITKVVYGVRGLSLLSFNEHGHFDGPMRDLLSYR